MNLLEQLSQHESQQQHNEGKLFEVTVVTGITQRKISGENGSIKFKLTDTVKYVKEQYRALVSNQTKLQDITLKNPRGALQNEKQLKEYNPGGRDLILTIWFNVHGGALEIKSYNFQLKPKYRIRNIDKNNGIHKLSKGACCMTLVKDSNNVTMPCYHTVNSDAMFEYLRLIVNRNNWDYRIICPVPNCNVEWDFAYCVEVACLNDEEYEAFNQEFLRRSILDTKCCPSCSNLCQRPDDLKHNRVACQACKKQDFCWICGNLWRGGGFTVCGNNECLTSEINEYLKNAEDTLVSGNITVPAIRACPKCYALTQHQSACKHMNCKSCGCDFCFVCLKTRENSKWQCNTGDVSSSNCGVAPRQTVK